MRILHRTTQKSLDFLKLFQSPIYVSLFSRVKKKSIFAGLFHVFPNMASSPSPHEKYVDERGKRRRTSDPNLHFFFQNINPPSLTFFKHASLVPKILFPLLWRCSNVVVHYSRVFTMSECASGLPGKGCHDHFGYK